MMIWKIWCTCITHFEQSSHTSTCQSILYKGNKGQLIEGSNKYKAIIVNKGERKLISHGKNRKLSQYPRS